jgi:hypothetical protein
MKIQHDHLLHCPQYAAVADELYPLAPGTLTHVALQSPARAIPNAAPRISVLFEVVSYVPLKLICLTPTLLLLKSHGIIATYLSQSINIGPPNKKFLLFMMTPPH